ncbi:MAG: SMP-30/gluconolactonase/LRE family protein [Glaciimonas sp.]|nr:SMP-30/gluconolactonase/LRE family protein [Glaciimonas sp.]
MNPVQVAFDQPMEVGECPLWHPNEAALYWVDIVGHAVHRLNPANNEHSSWQMPCEPGCIARNAAGGLIVALRTGFFHLNTDNGTLQTIAPAPYDTATTRFNDGRCDAAGRFWAGSLYEPRDRQLGTMYCLDQGVVRQHWSGVTVSNGLAFSPDNRTLYHADTTAHVIRRYAFDLEHGTASSPQVFRQFSNDKLDNYGGRPDGAAVDSEGAYWCAMFDGGRLLQLSPEGEILREIPLPLRCPTMIAFGGEDLRTLYITSARHNRRAAELAEYPLSGCVLSMRVDVPGLPEYAYFAGRASGCIA